MTWSQPAIWSMLATSFAVMGDRDLSLRSMRAYGKHGMTAVMRRALAVLQAEIMMSSSIRRSFGSFNGKGDGLDGLDGRDSRSLCLASGGKGVPGRFCSIGPSWP